MTDLTDKDVVYALLVTHGPATSTQLADRAGIDPTPTNILHLAMALSGLFHRGRVLLRPQGDGQTPVYTAVVR